jgi:hypothetical protein
MFVVYSIRTVCSVRNVSRSHILLAQNATRITYALTVLMTGVMCRILPRILLQLAPVAGLFAAVTLCFYKVIIYVNFIIIQRFQCFVYVYKYFKTLHTSFDFITIHYWEKKDHIWKLLQRAPSSLTATLLRYNCKHTELLTDPNSPVSYIFILPLICGNSFSVHLV